MEADRRQRRTDGSVGGRCLEFCVARGEQQAKIQQEISNLRSGHQLTALGGSQAPINDGADLVDRRVVERLGHGHILSSFADDPNPRRESACIPSPVSTGRQISDRVVHVDPGKWHDAQYRRGDARGYVAVDVCPTLIRASVHQQVIDH